MFDFSCGIGTDIGHPDAHGGEVKEHVWSIAGVGTVRIATEAGGGLALGDDNADGQRP